MLEISHPAEAEALISQNLMCNVTGIVYQVEEFRRPISVTQCFNCQSFGHSAKNCRSKQKCLICGESHSHKGCPNREVILIKDARTEKLKKQSVQTVQDLMLPLTEGVRNIKNRRSVNM